MRKGMNPSWLQEGGKVVALNLGADFTSEHEWGIGEIKKKLGMDGAVSRGLFSREKPKYTKPHGIARRIITKHDGVKLYVDGDRAALICYDSYWYERFEQDIQTLGITKAMKERLPHDLFTHKTLSTAWDEGSFGVYGQGEEAERIKDLYQAFQNDNIAIWIGGRQLAFENGGLIICIVDRAPADCVETMRAADADAEKLQAASDKTGILKRLADAKKSFFACSPRWIGASKSAHPVVYWLNPQEQDQNNCGWFTVEDLDLWIAGKGPIPMKVKV